ncbi:MAG: hypothetical protein ACJAZO_003672, partial [Myxococcota bacterium]
MISLLLALATAGECDVVQSCGTGHAFDLHHNAMQDPECAARLPIRRSPDHIPTPLRGVDKRTRDSFADFPNATETDNFIIKWGVQDRNISQQSVDSLLTALETSWDKYIDDWGYSAPFGADTFKFNVYVGNSGSGAPDDFGAGGYYWTDNEGYPMIVVSQGGLADPAFVGTLAAHEFFHAMQDANGAFEYDDTSGWWWEATAMWVQHEVFPEDEAWPVFLYWFAIRPELSVGYFEYPTDGSPEQFHQYGAFVYVAHVAERHGGPDLVQETFARSFNGDTPMDVLDELITESGSDIHTSFGEFVLRNGTWDYPTEQWFENYINLYGGYESPQSNRISGTVNTETNDWVAPEANLPHTFGANYWRFSAPSERFELEFEGAPDVQWHVGVATQTGTTHDTHSVVVTSGVGIAEISGLSGVDDAWIVVSATG